MTEIMVRHFICPACGGGFGDTADDEYRENPCGTCGRQVAYTTRDGVLTVSVDLREGSA